MLSRKHPLSLLPVPLLLLISACDHRVVAPESGVDVVAPSFSLQPLSPYTAIDMGTLPGMTYSNPIYGNSQGQYAGISRISISARENRAIFWDISTGMVDLGVLPGQNESWGEQVNELGQVVGWSYTRGTESHPFIWDAVTGMQNLGTLGGVNGRAYDINDLGQVVGVSRTASGQNHAFIWDELNGMVDLGIWPGGSWSAARDINNSGQVVGTADGFQGTSDNETHAVLWDPVQGIIDLGTLGGGSSFARRVNELGQVMGSSQTSSLEYHTFFWDPGEGMIDVGVGWADGMNELGQIVYWSNGYPTRGFFWDPGTGVATDIGTLGGDYAFPYAINDHGQAVGDSNTADDGFFAFVWDQESGMTNLGTLGGTWSYAWIIGNDGVIAGESELSNGEIHGTVWMKLSPVEAVDELVESVESLLGAAGNTINEGNVHSMVNQLNLAVANLGKGKPDTAVKKLELFIDMVEDRVAHGDLSEADGLILIEAAQQIIADIQGS